MPQLGRLLPQGTKMRKAQPAISRFPAVVPIILFCLMYGPMKTLTYLTDEMRFVLVPFKMFFPSLFIAGCFLLCIIFFLVSTICYMGWAILMQYEGSLEKSGKLMNVLLVLTMLAAITVQYSIDYKHSEARLKKGVEQYKQDGHMTSVDHIQHELECCGVWSFWDWNTNANYKCMPRNPFMRNWNCTLPSSCFKDNVMTQYEIKGKEVGHDLMFQLMNVYRFETSAKGDRTAFFLDFPTDRIHATGCQWRLWTLWSSAKSHMFVFALIIVFAEVTCRLVGIYVQATWKDTDKMELCVLPNPSVASVY